MTAQGSNRFFQYLVSEMDGNLNNRDQEPSRFSDPEGRASHRRAGHPSVIRLETLHRGAKDNGNYFSHTFRPLTQLREFLLP